MESYESVFVGCVRGDVITGGFAVKMRLYVVLVLVLCHQGDKDTTRRRRRRRRREGEKEGVVIVVLYRLWLPVESFEQAGAPKSRCFL